MVSVLKDDVFSESYLDEADLISVVGLVKQRLDLNVSDTRYDPVILTSIENNLLKISRFPVPIFMDNIGYRAYEKRINSEFDIPPVDLKYVARIKRVYFSTIKSDNSDISKKRLCRYTLDCADKDVILGIASSSDMRDAPEYYYIRNTYLYCDNYRHLENVKEQRLEIVYDGLPRDSHIFLRNCMNLLILGVLRDLYRNILKSPELFSLIDVSFSEEYTSLLEKDLSQYPKKIKIDKTYF